MNYYLGIDIGTSGTKTVCFDGQGNVKCAATRNYPLYTPQPGFAEQNPADWFTAVVETITEVVQQGYDIQGIGLSGQMHGLVLLDKFDCVLRNSIIWCDNRAFDEARQIEEQIGNERMVQITGNQVVPAFTLAKLLWVQKNEPEIFKQIDKILLPKDYIRYKLTGVFATEYSDASGMQLLDIYKKEFSKELCDFVGISLQQLPALVESSEKTGTILSDIVTATGLKETCFVVGGAGDQAAAAVGNGILSKGDVSLVLGSSGVVFSPLERMDLEHNQLQVFMHAIPNMYHVMGVTNGCGLSYKWYKEVLGNGKDYNALNEEAQKSCVGANGLMYLPYLNGERTPHLDPYATGTFIGIRQSTTHCDFSRAILEGISYSLKDCFALLPTSEYRVLVSGGGAKGTLWRSILASILEVGVRRIQQEEGGALGVAILAMVANKEYPSIQQACKSILQELDVIHPNPIWRGVYQKRYALYRRSYQCLKSFYKEAFNIEKEKEV